MSNGKPRPRAGESIQAFAARRYRELTANMSPKARKIFDRDPRAQRLRSLAGLQPVATREQIIRETARRHVEQQRNAPSVIPQDIRDMAAGIGAAANTVAFGLPARAVAAARGIPNDLAQAVMDEQGRRAPVTNFLANLYGSIRTGGAIGRGVASGVGRLASSGSQVAQQAGRVLQGATQLRQGQRVRNTLRVAGAGAAGGAAQGLGEGRNVAEYTATGGVAAPVLRPVFAAGEAAYRNIRNAAGFEPVAELLSRHIKTPISAIQREIDARAQRGLRSSIYEVLPLEDRQALDAAIGRMPARAKERVAALVHDRGQEIAQETSARAREIIRPFRERVEADIVRDMSAARPQGMANLPGDQILAHRAVRSPADMETLLREESRAIMAPFDNVRISDTVEGLLPTGYQSAGRGRITQTISEPDVATAIRNNAGAPRRAGGPEGITVRDVTDIMSNIRNDRSLPQGIRDRALAHLQDVIENVSPEAADASRRMTAAYAARSRMAEGLAEGMETRTRDTVKTRGISTDSATAARTAQKVRNRYDTPEGTAGRSIGQGLRLEQELGTSPRQVFGVLDDIASNPQRQRAITENLDPGAADQLTDLALQQRRSVQRLAGLDRETATDGASTINMFQNLMMLGPQTLPVTKIRAVVGIIKNQARIPEKQATELAEQLFSGNPTRVSRALKSIEKFGAGREILRSINRDFVAGRLYGDVGEAVLGMDGGDPSPQQDFGASNGVDPVEASEWDEFSDPVEASEWDEFSDPVEGSEWDEFSDPVGESPYAQDLQHIYDTETPELLDLISRVEAQESGGRQHDDDGRPLTSSAGAVGVMQVMPGTAPEAAAIAGVPWDENAYRNDPTYNRILGIAYLSEMLRRYDGDVELALAAYNAGPGRADEYAAGRRGLPAETQNYISRIAG